MRVMRWRTGGRATFARPDSVLELLALCARGYRPHETAFGWVMARRYV